MSLYRLFVDSDNGVDIDPEYDFERNDTKIENRHRTRDASEFVYKWAQITKFKFGLMYVNSSDASVINSYWSSNAEVKFMEVGVAASVESVHLTNKNNPMRRNIRPYGSGSTALFKGKIELSTY